MLTNIVKDNYYEIIKFKYINIIQPFDIME